MNAENPSRFRDAVFNLMLASTQGALKRFDPQTGRFPDAMGQWRVANQDVIYPLALIYRVERPNNPFFNSSNILTNIVAGADALMAIQNEDGRFVMHKNGAIWGNSNNCWAMYHWLEALTLLADDLDDPIRLRWVEALQRAFTGSAEGLESSLRQVPPHLSNIGVWHAMALVRAGNVFDRPVWRTIGERYMRVALNLQHADGFWPEGGTPSTSYQSMWTHAVGLYYHFTHDRNALSALERALEFTMTTTYPDGSTIETPDGRCRYHEQPEIKGLSAHTLFPKGRRYARFLVDQLARLDPATIEPQNLATAYVHASEGDEPPMFLDDDTYLRTHGDRLLVRRRRPWLYCLSGYVTPTADLFENWHHRFHCDRQNLLSVWHDTSGVLVGGGNSKGQPEFSTFAVQRNRSLQLAPDLAEVSIEEDNALLRLAYGDVKTSLSVAFTDDDALALTFTLHEAPGDDTRVRAGLTIRPKPGSTLQASGGESFIADPKIRHRMICPPTPTGGLPTLTGENWTLKLPKNNVVKWPIHPFNPYMINGVSSLDQAVVRVCFDLTADVPECVVLLRIFSEIRS